MNSKPLTEIRAVLFDMDGLIFDTEGLHKQCWQAAAEQLGYTISDELYQNFIGVQSLECERLLLEALGSDFPLPAFTARRRALRDALAEQEGVALKPGFVELMRELRERRLACALVTSSKHNEVLANFGELAELEQFACLITAEKASQSKPHPEPYLNACQALGVLPEQCLVLEDSNNGMRSGLDAGCLAAMIPDLLPPASDVHQRAHGIYDSLEQVRLLLCDN